MTVLGAKWHINLHLSSLTSKKNASKPHHYNRSSTLPASSTAESKHKNRHASVPDYQTSPGRVKHSSLPQSEGPTPKPRLKVCNTIFIRHHVCDILHKKFQSPTKEKQFVVEKSMSSNIPSRSPKRKSKMGRITATTAREDFESMLASDYNASNMMSEEFMSGQYPSFPGNYRPNQEIFVDDVIFR